MRELGGESTAGVVDGGDPGAGGSLLVVAEDFAEGGVGKDSVDGKIGLLLFRKLPHLLFRLRLASTVHRECARGLVRRRRPGVINVFLVPGIGVDGDFGVGFCFCYSGGGGSVDEAFDGRGFLGGGEGVEGAGDGWGDDFLGVALVECKDGGDMSDAGDV